MTDIVREIKALVALKGKGELNAEEFASAKAVLFTEAAQKGVDTRGVDDEKTGEKRRARRRSVKDFLKRIGGDCQALINTSEDPEDYVDTKLNNMFALGVKWAGPGYILEGNYDAMIRDFFVEDGSGTAVYSIEDAATSPVLKAGVKDVWSGTYSGAENLANLFRFTMSSPSVTDSGMEFKYNLKDAKIVRIGQDLYIDFGWTPLVSKKTKKEYEVYVKLHNTYVEGEQRVTCHKFILAKSDGFFALLKDDGLFEQFESLVRA